jgi:hypothetical protein
MFTFCSNEIARLITAVRRSLLAVFPFLTPLKQPEIIKKVKTIMNLFHPMNECLRTWSKSAYGISCHYLHQTETTSFKINSQLRLHTTMWDTVILWVIIGLAAGASIRTIYLTFSGKKTNCSCSKIDCQGCPASQTTEQQVNQINKPAETGPSDKKA